MLNPEQLNPYDIGSRLAHLRQLYELWENGLSVLRTDAFRSPTASSQVQQLEDALKLLAQQIKDTTMSEDAHDSNSIDNNDNPQHDPGIEHYLEANLAKAIAKSEVDGGFFLDSLKVGARLLVRTKNTTYTINKLENGYEIWGHEKYCPSPTKVYISGSTFGGSVLKAGFVGRGMHLEFNIKDNGALITTSEIQSIVEI